MRVVSKKAARRVRHIRVSSVAHSSSPYAFSAPYLITETAIPSAARVAAARNTVVDLTKDGLPTNPLNDPSDPTSFSRLTDDFSTLTLANTMEDQTPLSSSNHPGLNSQDVEISNTGLCLHSDWTYKDVQNRFNVDESGIDKETARAAILQEKDICLRNIRHIARYHGFDLKEMFPDVFPEQNSPALSPATISTQPSESSLSRAYIVCPIGPSAESKDFLDNMELGEVVDANDPGAVAIQADIARIHNNLNDEFTSGAHAF